MVQMEPVPNGKILDELYNSDEIAYNARGSELSDVIKPIGLHDKSFIFKDDSRG